VAGREYARTDAEKPTARTAGAPPYANTGAGGLTANFAKEPPFANTGHTPNTCAENAAEREYARTDAENLDATTAGPTLIATAPKEGRNPTPTPT